MRASMLNAVQWLALATLLVVATAASGQDIPAVGAGLTDPFQPEQLAPDALTGEQYPDTFDSPPLATSGNVDQWAGQFSAAEGYSTSDSSCKLDLGCDGCPNYGLIAFLGYDAFRGHPDGSWENNGLSTGLNFGTRLGKLSDWTGIGMQLGGSVGVYDWSGTDYRAARQDQAEVQGFVTGGFFRKATDDCRFSAALVQDWMINSNFSVFASNPTLGQWRGQVGYAINRHDEAGVWGTWRGQGDTRDIAPFGPVTWRPINQFNVYWHHHWGSTAADTWIWIGVPEGDRLNGNGSLGDYLAGALANCPLSDRVGLYALVTYMHPSSSPGPAGAIEEAWNFSIGLSFYTGRSARSDSVAGRCWLPQLPVANNGYFLVDASQTY